MNINVQFTQTNGSLWCVSSKQATVCPQKHMTFQVTNGYPDLGSILCSPFIYALNYNQYFYNIYQKIKAYKVHSSKTQRSTFLKKLLINIVAHGINKFTASYFVSGLNNVSDKQQTLVEVRDRSQNNVVLL